MPPAISGDKDVVAIKPSATPTVSPMGLRMEENGTTPDSAPEGTQNRGKQGTSPESAPEGTQNGGKQGTSPRQVRCTR